MHDRFTANTRNIQQSTGLSGKCDYTALQLEQANFLNTRWRMVRDLKGARENRNFY
jgi:hypothetical protein